MGKHRSNLLNIGLMTLILSCTGGGNQDLKDAGGNPTDMTPQKRVMLGKYDIENMTTKDMAEAGEVIIFGRLTDGNPNTADVGKGLCPLCHNVTGTVMRDAAPDLTANHQSGVPIGLRGELRIRDPRYRRADFVKNEAFAGSRRATTGFEYIVESHVCPSCYVVAGFGKKGTNDRESPMVAMHLPPNCQTIEEAIMIDTYLYMKDSFVAPPPEMIRAAYEKFIPESKRTTTSC